MDRQSLWKNLLWCHKMMCSEEFLPNFGPLSASLNWQCLILQWQEVPQASVSDSSSFCSSLFWSKDELPTKNIFWIFNRSLGQWWTDRLVLRTKTFYSKINHSSRIPVLVHTKAALGGITSVLLDVWLRPTAKRSEIAEAGIVVIMSIPQPKPLLLRIAPTKRIPREYFQSHNYIHVNNPNLRPTIDCQL